MADTRKLIGFGKNSFVISVPKVWVEKNNLKKGHSLTLIEKGSEILITCSDSQDQRILKEAIINCNESEGKMLKTKIVSAYVNDYNTIMLRGINSAKKAKEIRSILHDLVAMEIIEQTTDKIVAKDFLNTQDSSVSTILRRMDIITRAMMSDSILCFEEDQHESVYERDADVNRLSHLSFRMIKKGLIDSRIAKKLEMDNTQLLSAWLITQNLESIADTAKRISKELKTTKKNNNSNNEIKTIYKRIQSNYLDVLKAHYTNNKDLAYKVLDKNQPLMLKLTSLSETTKEKELNAVLNQLKILQNCVKQISIIIINSEN